MKAVEKKNAKETDEQVKHAEMVKASTALEETALPAFIRLAWLICARDLELTVKAVSKFLLKDVPVPWILRIRRAQALLMLGQTFVAAAETADKTAMGRELLESAMIGMMT